MYEFLECKGIQKFRENGCWSYLLNDEDKFSKSGYKSAQLLLKNCMLKCSIVRFNGLLKFIYFTENYKSLTEILSTVQPNVVWDIFSKLIASIIKVKEYGYLSCDNIDISPQCIYVDPKTLEPYLIYVPLVAENSSKNQEEFEESLKRSLITALRESNNVLGINRENQLLEILKHSGQGLDEMLNAMMKESGKRGGDGKSDVSSQLRIVCADKRIPIDYTMNSEKLTIGRRKENDVVVDFTNQVSRLHCSISQREGRFFLKDENSTYGTAVNGNRCYPGKEVELHDGDRLSIPGIQFVIKIQAK